VEGVILLLCATTVVVVVVVVVMISTTTTTTVVAVKIQKSPWTDFLTGDKFKYAPAKRLNGQSEVFYYTANENSRDHYKLCTDKSGEYAEKYRYAHLSTFRLNG